MYTQRAVSPKRKTTDWTPWLLMTGVAVMGFALFAAMMAFLVLTYLSDDRAASGVRVAGMEVGRQSEQAMQTLFASQPVASQIVAVDGEREWPVPIDYLGISLDIPATINAVLEAPANAQVAPRYTIDLARAQEGLVALSEQVNIDAVPGDPPQIGRAMEIPVILDRLRLDASGELADGRLDLAMITVEPPPVEEAAPSYTGPTTTHVVERGQELGLIARQYGVSMADIVRLNAISNPDLLFVGQELIIPAAGVFTPDTASAPPAPRSTGKAIVVSTADQRVYAYENGQLVRSHLVSTGRTETPTVLGDYNIYVKYQADDMSGPDYFLPQVPYTMYFYRGYAIHGTYWHNSFGRPMSHGCVNLPVAEAEWWFNWAEVGTLVRVI